MHEEFSVSFGFSFPESVTERPLFTGIFPMLSLSVVSVLITAQTPHAYGICILSLGFCYVRPL